MLRVKGKNKRSRCIVPGCVSSTGEEKLTCFTFPKNPDLRRKWEKFCQKSSERIESSLDYICERHFNVTDILWRRQT